MNNQLIVISGMSGSGKTFLISKALQIINEISVVTAVTTRPRRTYEDDLSTSKCSISEEEFLTLLAGEKLCCINNVYGYLYAFCRDDIAQKLENGPVILEYKASLIDDIKAVYPDAIAIYIYSQNIEQIMLRLRQRENWKERLEKDISERNFILKTPAEIHHFDRLFENKFDKQSLEEFIQCIAMMLN